MEVGCGEGEVWRWGVVRVMCGGGGGEGDVWRWGVVRVKCGGGVW